jgi:SAM-dependent methyltransferase
VVGIDASAEVIAEARAAATASGLDEGQVTFTVGDVFALEFEDDTFDVVHAHQVLQHLGDPVAALGEMGRVCRPGGVVAVRDADYPAMRYFPDSPGIARAIEAYGALTRINGAHWDGGRRLLSWAQQAGFATVTPSASVWCFAIPEERAWWGGLWAERFTRSALAEQLLAHGLATPDVLDGFARSWLEWSEAADGWFAVLHGEVLCRA